MVRDKRRSLIMSFEELKSAIHVGLTFDKPTVQSSIVNVMDNGFYYSIGQDGKSKKVTYDVLEKCFQQLNQQNNLSRAWFKETFPSIEKIAPCNFTTIGGLFQYFNLAYYEKANYKKRNGSV